MKEKHYGAVEAEHFDKPIFATIAGGCIPTIKGFNQFSIKLVFLEMAHTYKHNDILSEFRKIQEYTALALEQECQECLTTDWLTEEDNPESFTIHPYFVQVQWEKKLKETAFQTESLSSMHDVVKIKDKGPVHVLVEGNI